MARAPTPKPIYLIHSSLPLLCRILIQGCTIDFVWCPVVTFFRLLIFLFLSCFASWLYQAVLLISFNTRPFGLPYSAVATWPERALNVATHGFIGYYRDVRGTDMKSLCWRGELGGMPQTPLAWHCFFRAAYFTSLMISMIMTWGPSSKICALATEWGHAKALPIRPRTC